MPDPSGRAPVLFFHVQHLLGIGHQMRAAALARACVSQGIEVHYVSGGFPDRDFDLGGAIYHQLPPVRVQDADFSRMVDENGELIDEDWWAARSTASLSLFEEIGPDLLLLEGFPFARRKFSRELLPLIDRAKECGLPVATSVRDILVTPKAEKRDKAIAAASALIDAVLVHGDPSLVRLEDSFPGVESLGPKLFYTGYVDGGAPVTVGDKNRDQGEIVVSVGGGAVGMALIDCAIETQKRIGGPHEWRILLGPNLPENYVQDLNSANLDPKITLGPARPDFRQLLATAALSISQAGYNTVMDILAAGCPAVLVPFAKDGENEQSLRAELLAQRGQAQVLSEKHCRPELLAGAVRRALDRPTDGASPNARTFPFALTGADASARLLHAMIRRKQGRL